MKFYKTTNLWDRFREEFPVISRIPVLGHWAFGNFARGYYESKLTIRNEKP